MKFSSSESLVISAYFIEMELSEFVVKGVFELTSNSLAPAGTWLKIHNSGE